MYKDRVLESNRFESGGGYSDGRSGSLGHNSCAKRIVVAMVVVEQDMAIVENLSRWSFSSYVRMSLRALYNCDKIRNFLGDSRKHKLCSAIIPHPCVLGVCGTRPCCTVVPSFICFSHARVLGYHTCCIVVHGFTARACLQSVLKNRIEPCPWHARVFHSQARVNPIKFTHGHVARPWGFIRSIFWGNHVLLPHNCIARPCLFPCLATTLGTSRVPGHVCCPFPSPC
ncbi:hypothetical protein GOBAR_AA13076 [Gossypium barbadense]|uniref:Uncharacterized protein n=1 Tax=Gossypium barbadense TaxID=3634 RepID=A0A2P5XW81_GOSBA|nr:hypothetical protein GOBAR_AA13076 [Gossypium barbadense]